MASSWFLFFSQIPTYRQTATWSQTRSTKLSVFATSMIRDCPTTSSPTFRTQTTTPLCPFMVRQLYSLLPYLFITNPTISFHILPTCQRQLPYRTLATPSTPCSVFCMSFPSFAFRISPILIPTSSTLLVTCTKVILYPHPQFSPFPPLSNPVRSRNSLFNYLIYSYKSWDSSVSIGTLNCAIPVVYIQGLSKRFEHLLLWPPKSPDLTPCDFFL